MKLVFRCVNIFLSKNRVEESPDLIAFITISDQVEKTSATKTVDSGLIYIQVKRKRKKLAYTGSVLDVQQQKGAI